MAMKMDARSPASQDLDALQRLMAAQTQALVEALKAERRREIPSLVDEKQIANGVNTLTWQAQSRNVAKITSIYAYAPAGAATLTLDDRQIPVQGGTVLYLPDLVMLLKPFATRTFAYNTAGVTGYLHVELMGEEMADKGAW